MRSGEKLQQSAKEMRNRTSITAQERFMIRLAFVGNSIIPQLWMAVVFLPFPNSAYFSFFGTVGDGLKT
jgi:hypothetical protein